MNKPKGKRPPNITIPPRNDLTYPRPKTVDRITPSARDRIEDMKIERDNKWYGWDY